MMPVSLRNDPGRRCVGLLSRRAAHHGGLRALGFICILLGLATRAAAQDISGSPSWRGGVVIEHVEKGSAGEKAGMTPGDLILAWSRAPVKAKIDSPFDFAEVEIEQGSRGAVNLEGRRGSEQKVRV